MMKGFIATIILLGCLAPAAGAATGEVTLRSNAAVGKGFVRMSDLATVADCAAETAETINGTFCGSAPQPGEERVIDLSYIKMRLTQNGVDVSTLKFSGAQEVKVTSAAIITVIWPGEEPHGEQVAARAVSSVGGTLEERIVARLRSILVESEAANPEDISIKMKNISRIIKAAPPESEVVSVSQVGEKGGASDALFTVVLSTKDKKQIRGTVIAQVSLLSNVVVAKNEIQPDQKITEADVVLAKAEISGSARNYFRSVSEVVGMTAEKNVKAGQAVVSAAISRPVLVKRGDIVTVEARCVGSEIRVRTSAVAQQNAKLGETIKVKNASSGQEFMAKVIGDKQVEIVVGEDK